MRNVQKLTGWTNREFVPCDGCKEEVESNTGVKFICQANRYTIHTKRGTRYYCQHHADIKEPPEKRKQRKEEKEKNRKNESDDRDRDWYWQSGAHRYI